MSQAGIIDILGSYPTIPTTFVANTGIATPVLNELNILAQAVPAGSSPARTVASGNTLTVDVQTTQAIASTNASAIGLAAFNSSYFTVDANGFVTPTGGTALTFDGDSGTATPSAGMITISGGTTGLTTSASGSTVALTGILKLANGGTNANLTASNGGIFYSTATAGAILAGTATARQMLQSGSSTTPAWSTTTWPATTTINQILYSSSANTVAGLSTANNGTLITGTTGIPSLLANGTTGQVLTATTGSPPSWANPATSGTVTTVSVVTSNGFAGTVANATTTPAITLTTSQTGLLSGNGTSITGTAITQYNVLTAGASNAPNSVAPSATSGVPLISQGSSSQPVFGTAVVAGGGTGAVSFNTNGVVISNTSGTGALAALSLTSGQLVIGGTTTPAAATLSAGTGISITNGNNAITISATTSGFTWTDVTSGAQTVAAENGYFADKSTLTTFTLPTNNSLGDTIKIVGKGTGGWTIVYTTGQNINFSGSTTTTTSGSLSSTAQYDCVELVCSVASASAPIFTVVNAVGNLTVV